MYNIIDRLFLEHDISDSDISSLLMDKIDTSYLFSKADEVRKLYYGNDVYIRGLIEISSFCKNNCFYCGIRAGNMNAERYRLSNEEIIQCCIKGYDMGIRTFVLQGGEDSAFTDEIICSLVSDIKRIIPECAVTLSLGEKSYESYLSFRKAGADRYLLRHETADDLHYHKLHPDTMNPVNRKECLFNLKKIGFQTGAGFMVGSPFQTVDHIISDIRFLQELKPEMIGIGPFIHCSNTPFENFDNGNTELCLKLIAMLRLFFPDALIPATTALGTASPDGRERGLKAGANVVMPNLSPVSVRKKYSLYDDKICTGEESAECLDCLKRRIESVGYTISFSRGDHNNIKRGVF